MKILNKKKKIVDFKIVPQIFSVLLTEIQFVSHPEDFSEILGAWSYTATKCAVDIAGSRRVP
jgi:hypothetical protein